VDLHLAEGGACMMFFLFYEKKVISAIFFVSASGPIIMSLSTFNHSGRNVTLENMLVAYAAAYAR